MSSDSGISERVVAEEVRRFLEEAATLGSLETLTRRLVIESVAKQSNNFPSLKQKLGIEEAELREHKTIIKDEIGKFYSENDHDEQAPSEDGKRKSSADVQSEIPAKKVKRDNDTTDSRKQPVSPAEDKLAEPDLPKGKTDLEEEVMKSESELSVLIDEPPKRKNAKKPKAESGKTSRKAKEKAPLSKNEDTIKKYKTLITACGVRKQWAKELAHCETDGRKIAHLKGMLSDLGMTGRMSMDQAKAIREKRELKQEIEDVVNFEKHKGINSVARGSRVDKNVDSNEGTDESDDEPSAAPPTKRKPSAARSIMTFLKGQSDSENE